MLFLTFYGENEVVNDFTKNQMVTYLWLRQAFLAFIALWMRDHELFDLIKTGNIAYELCRPINIYGFWYSKLISSRLASVILRFSPILIIAFTLPAPYGLELPQSIASGLLFVVSLLLGVMVNVAISMFIYISVFVTVSPMGSLLL